MVSFLTSCLLTSTGISSHRLYMKPPRRFVCVSHRCNDKVPLDFTSKINRISGCLTAATLFLCHSLCLPNPPALCFLLQSVPRFLNPTRLTHSPSFISVHPNTVCPKGKINVTYYPLSLLTVSFLLFFFSLMFMKGKKKLTSMKILQKKKKFGSNHLPFLLL